MPTTEAAISPSEKREALEDVLNSQTFSRSAQLRSFLQYVCEHELSGHLEEISEYQIAVHALGRTPDFNMTEDSAVRNRAYELRQRLEKFYSSERTDAQVRIDIPRGSYVPRYSRPPLTPKAPAAEVQLPEPMLPRRSRLRPAFWFVIAGCFSFLVIGVLAGVLLSRNRPPEIVKDAWGPLADPGEQILISMATSLHMMVRPHIAPHALRFTAPDELYSIYGPNRPLPEGTKLYMEPSQIAVPFGEVVAATTLCRMRSEFGGLYQILPESEAPVPALRGRNSVLLGSGTNSTAAVVLLRNMPLTIDYTKQDNFAVIDQRKPADKETLFVSQPSDQPVPITTYGLLTILTTTDSTGRRRRILIVSGSSSASIQAGVEFFCSPSHLRELRARLGGSFPPNYQVVLRCKAVGLRLISYEYVMQIVVPKGL